MLRLSYEIEDVKITIFWHARTSRLVTSCSFFHYTKDGGILKIVYTQG